ncbi:MAG: transposase [Verrucomicrobiales bacterium]
MGAVHPKSGKLVSLIVPHCDGDVFQGFLDTMAEEAPPTQGRRCVLVLDNASWHKVKTLNWHYLEPVDLPPDSPDSNPIERLWQPLNRHSLAGFITKSGDEPTIGLHMADVRKFIEVLHSLIDDGHTVLVIDSNTDLMAEPGEEGGKLLVDGSPEDVAQHKTNRTAPFRKRALFQWFRHLQTHYNPMLAGSVATREFAS